MVEDVQISTKHTCGVHRFRNISTRVEISEKKLNNDNLNFVDRQKFLMGLQKKGKDQKHIRYKGLSEIFSEYCASRIFLRNARKI